MLRAAYILQKGLLKDSNGDKQSVLLYCRMKAETTQGEIHRDLYKMVVRAMEMEIDIEKEHKKMKQNCILAKVCRTEVCPLQCGNYKTTENLIEAETEKFIKTNFRNGKVSAFNKALIRIAIKHGYMIEK